MERRHKCVCGIHHISLIAEWYTMSEPIKARTKVAICFLAIVVMTFLIFIKAIRYEFVNFDDSVYVKKNPVVQSLSWNSIRWMFSNVFYHQYIPLTLLSHALDYAIWKNDPRGHHLTNILLHSVNAGLVFLLALVLLRMKHRQTDADESAGHGIDFSGALPLFGASVSALLFSLHPLRVESVAWVSDRKDLLCGLFLITSLLAYVRYASLRVNGMSWGWYIAFTGLFLLALLSKVIAVVAPVILLSLDYLLLPKYWRVAPSRMVIEKLPMFLFAAIVGGVTILTPFTAKPGIIVSQLAGVERVLFPFYSLFFYVQKFLVPVDLAPMYGSPGVAMMVFALMMIVGLCILCIVAGWRGNRVPLVVLVTSGLLLVATIIGFSSGSQPFADRYFYLASIGVCVMIGGGLQKVWDLSKQARVVLAIAACVLVGVLAMLTLRQLDYWQNSETLWRHVLAIGSPSIEYMDGYTNLQQAYLAAGKYNEAEEVFGSAIAIDPASAVAHFNMGYVWYYRGQIDSALALFRETVRLDSTYAEAFYAVGILNISLRNQGAGIDSLKIAARLGDRDARQFLVRSNVRW